MVRVALNPRIAQKRFDLLFQGSPFPHGIRHRFVFWKQNGNLLFVADVFAENDRAINFEDAQSNLIAQFHGLIIDRP
jgi:hypothetical protein